MRRTYRSPVSRLLSALALAALCALPAVAQTGGAKQTLLVFPLDRSENIDPDLAEVVSAGLRNRIDKSGRYEYMTYNTRSALVQRAIQSGSVTRDESDGPFADGVGPNIARALGLDLALTGSVEDATLDTATNTATVTVTAQLLMARDGKPLQTASTSGSATETGMAPDALLRRAADAAAEKLASQLFGAPVVTPLTPTTPKPPGTVTNGAPAGLPTDGIPLATKERKKSNSLLIVGGIALLGLIIAAAGSSGGGGGNGGGTGGGPPPIPL